MMVRGGGMKRLAKCLALPRENLNQSVEGTDAHHELSNLSRHYGEDETLVKALDDISVSIGKEDCCAPWTSGSGKTTLLNTISA